MDEANTALRVWIARRPHRVTGKGGGGYGDPCGPTGGDPVCHCGEVRGGPGAAAAGQRGGARRGPGGGTDPGGAAGGDLPRGPAGGDPHRCGPAVRHHAAAALPEQLFPSGGPLRTGRAGPGDRLPGGEAGGYLYQRLRLPLHPPLSAALHPALYEPAHALYLRH